MTNFFHEDEFYSELQDLIEKLELDETINEESDDYSLMCSESQLEPLVTLSYDWIMERIDEERFPEENDRVDNKVKLAIKSIDFDKVNSLMPKLYYETKKTFYITKAEILEYMKN